MMMICASNQRGVDIVLPICYSGDVLCRDIYSEGGTDSAEGYSFDDRFSDDG